MSKQFKGIMFAALGAIAVSGCHTLVEKPSEDAPATLRAGFAFSCPHGIQSDAQVESLGALLGAELIAKGVTTLVSFANDQLQKAAKEDAEAFTLTSSSPEYLLGINSNTKKQGVQCLMVAAGPTKPGANICTTLKKEDKLFGGVWDNWCGENSASAPLWAKWGFEDVHFVAQIELSMVEGGAPSYRVPQVKQIYYPKSISGRPKDKIKGLVLEISAADATDPKNPQIFTVRLDGKGIVPGLDSQKAIPLSDKWIVISPQPKEQLVKDQALSRPVNLKVTVSETPRPNWILQKAAKLAADKEDEVAEKLSKAAVQQWVPEERTKATRDEASADRAAKLKLAGLCDSMFTRGQALEMAKAAKPIENPISVAAAELDQKKRENAVKVASINFEQAQADAQAAWTDAGKDSALCTGDY